MDKKDKELIQRNYIVLSDAIVPEIELLTTDLWQRGLISETMKENVLEVPKTDRKRAMALLDLVPRRGPKAMEAFYTSCKACQLWDAADILRPEAGPHQPDILDSRVVDHRGGGDRQVKSGREEEDSSDEESLPMVWPPQEPKDLARVKVRKAVDFEQGRAARYRRKYERSLTPKGKEKVYSMKSKKRAYVMIINNEKFEKLDDRDGTNHDEKGIYSLFASMGCYPKRKKNLKAKEMWAAFKDVAHTEGGFAPYDCFILFVLTHGHKGVVFGTDGYHDKEKGTHHNTLEIQKITDLFSDVDSLQGKPKLFFFQACQGTGRDPGKPVRLTEATDSGQAATPDPTERSDAAEVKGQGSPSLTYLVEEQSDSSGDKIPSRKDTFVAMATTPDNVSWRRVDFGTWFIQAVIEVFERYAYKLDLHRLMRNVNSLLAKAETMKGMKQIMEKKDTFDKDFYFFPGFPGDQD